MERIPLTVMCLSGLWCFSVCASRHYTLVEVALPWSEAQSFCRAKYTDLATAENQEELEEVVNVGRRYYNGMLWIGLYDDIDSWRWSLDEEGYYDAGGADLRMWKASEPNHGNGNENCVVMNPEGTWNDAPCQTTFQFVCYNAAASPRFTLVTDLKTWHEAQSYCREHYTDLASVRNNTENAEIKDLSSQLYKWIGLHRDSWKWSDQSPFSFTRWNAEKPTGLPCVTLHKGHWVDDDCEKTLFFVCQTVRVKKWVMRMQLSGEDSASSLDDATDAMLQQLSGRLNNSGLALSWKKQPDGKIFHPQAKAKDDKHTCSIN